MGKPILAWGSVTAMAVDKDICETSLKDLLIKIRKEKGMRIVSEKFLESVKVDKPLPNVTEAYSSVVELELEFATFNRVLYFLLWYGPSALELQEPNVIDVKISDAQETINELATFIHRYTQAGAGGIVVQKS